VEKCLSTRTKGGHQRNTQQRNAQHIDLGRWLLSRNSHQCNQQQQLLQKQKQQ
jgi:hypothetical protein